jgi:hypothetical protein
LLLLLLLLPLLPPLLLLCFISGTLQALPTPIARASSRTHSVQRFSIQDPGV